MSSRCNARIPEVIQSSPVIEMSLATKPCMAPCNRPGPEVLVLESLKLSPRVLNLTVSGCMFCISSTLKDAQFAKSMSQLTKRK